MRTQSTIDQASIVSSRSARNRRREPVPGDRSKVLRPIVGGLLVFATVVSLMGLPVSAEAAACVTRAEFRYARLAWQAEGMVRAGIHSRFGWDGTLVSRVDGVMTRRYRGCAGDLVIVRYRHFEEAPGPATLWWVVTMRRTT